MANFFAWFGIRWCRLAHDRVTIPVVCDGQYYYRCGVCWRKFLAWPDPPIQGQRLWDSRVVRLSDVRLREPRRVGPVPVSRAPVSYRSRFLGR